MNESGAPTTLTSETPLEEGLHCPDCDYDLRGLTGARCPECGFDLAPLRACEPLIPWSQRGSRGWFVAYWQTVWMALHRPRQLCLEIARPVSGRDAVLFLRITQVLAALGLLGSIVLGMWLLGPNGEGFEEPGLWVGGGLALWVLLVLLVMPRLMKARVRTRHLTVTMHERSRSLLDYSFAPLALLPALPAIQWAGASAETQAGIPTILTHGLVVPAILLLITIWVARQHGRMAERLPVEKPALFSWATLGDTLLYLVVVFGLALVPLSVFYVVLIVVSFKGL